MQSSDPPIFDFAKIRFCYGARLCRASAPPPPTTGLSASASPMSGQPPASKRPKLDAAAAARSPPSGYGARVTLLLVAFVVTGIAAGGAPLLGLLFGDTYELAAGALMPLLAAMALFSALYVVASVCCSVDGQCKPQQFSNTAQLCGQRW